LFFIVLQDLSITHMVDLNLKPIGTVQSALIKREDCPLQGDEGAPEAWLKIDTEFLSGLQGLKVGNEIILLTWFHLADREVVKCYPRNQINSPHVGVFTTRSPDRPKPIGLHPVKVLAIEPGRVKVHPLEALDGTLLLDIKPVI
jgi:tRNA-Thr(GGU) m(6)t(6)A37 methyltransferase TsaA